MLSLRIESPIWMQNLRPKPFPALLILILVFQSSGLVADPVPVRHIEGVTLGFLVLRNLSGEALAYGDLKQVVQDDGLVVDDLQFHFKDGSSYREITKFTQHGEFRLVSD